MVFPTSLLPLALGIPFGLLFGVGIYRFGYARGASCLTDDPTACANCHVMREQVDGWRTSSHRSAAVCNDSHTPPELVTNYCTSAAGGRG
jgi:cytochrome c nitrite reductase small subunit